MSASGCSLLSSNRYISAPYHISRVIGVLRVGCLSLSVDHMATSVAHVAHCVLLCVVEKNSFILVLVCAIWSTFLGLPRPLPVLT